MGSLAALRPLTWTCAVASFPSGGSRRPRRPAPPAAAGDGCEAGAGGRNPRRGELCAADYSARLDEAIEAYVDGVTLADLARVPEIDLSID